MAFRGRGRRGGRWGQGFKLENRYGKGVEYVLFPEDVKLPRPPVTPEEIISLCRKKRKLEYCWKDSCYHLDDTFLKPNKDDKEIERYADSLKKGKRAKREDFAYYMKLISSNFPLELIAGLQGVKMPQKKLRWDKAADKKLDFLEKLDALSKDGGGGIDDDDKEKEKEIDSSNETGNEDSEKEEDDEGDYVQTDEDTNIQNKDTAVDGNKYIRIRFPSEVQSAFQYVANRVSDIEENIQDFRSQTSFCFNTFHTRLHEIESFNKAKDKGKDKKK